MTDPIIHVGDYCRAMGIQHLGDLWRLAPDVRRARWAQFERDVAAGKVQTHGARQPSTPLRLGDPVQEALDDADLRIDRTMDKAARQQAARDGTPQKFERLMARRQEAYIRDHDLGVQAAWWHAANDLCRQSDDDLRLWARRIRAGALAIVLQREAERRDGA